MSDINLRKLYICLMLIYLLLVSIIIAQFINHLSAFMSIYLLVFMSIDRYLAVVHAIDSIANYRTAKNTTTCIMYDIYFFFPLSASIKNRKKRATYYEKFFI
jgi:hypothetical protein